MMKNAARAALVAAVAALGLAACGGGGDSSPTSSPAPSAGNEVPAAASQSVPGLINWASTLPQSDTATPLATDTFRPPVDDTAQPMSV